MWQSKHRFGVDFVSRKRDFALWGLWQVVHRPPATGLWPCLPPVKVVLVMALVAEVGLLHQEKLFRPGLMGCMAGQAGPLLHRRMGEAVRECALVVAGVAQGRAVCHEQVFRVLGMRIVAGRAFPGDDGLVLHSGPVGDAGFIMAAVAQLRHVERSEASDDRRSCAHHGRTCTAPPPSGNGCSACAAIFLSWHL